MSPSTFKDAYAVLQQHAQTLRDQPEPDVDTLLAIVSESTEAYKVCCDRIQAVESLLEKPDPVVAPTPRAPQRATWTPPAKAIEPFDGADRAVPFFRLLIQPKFQDAIHRLN
jgi:hypothetical protein